MTDWTKEWPEQRGWYWFYGQTSKMMWDMRPEYFPVLMREDGVGKPSYVTRGQFLYKAEGARGLWTRMIMPNQPTDYQIEEVLAGV